jgi:hypothetical protein
MARRRSDDGGCAVFLLLIIASCLVGHFYGERVGWLVFFMVWFFVAIA